MSYLYLGLSLWLAIVFLTVLVEAPNDTAHYFAIATPALCLSLFFGGLALKSFGLF